MRLAIPALALLSVLMPAPSAAAERGFTVTSFDRVRVDGPFAVRLTTGVAPFARASGSQRALDSVYLGVEGRTLVVRPSPSTWGGYPGQSGGTVAIEVGTHELVTAWLNGSGSLVINRAKGLVFNASIQGSGAMTIAEVASDRLIVAINGSGTAAIGGRTKSLNAVVRGAGSLNASALKAGDAVVSADGPAVVQFNASNSARINAAGVASVTVGGKPACTVRISGSASVAGC